MTAAYMQPTKAGLPNDGRSLQMCLRATFVEGVVQQDSQGGTKALAAAPDDFPVVFDTYWCILVFGVAQVTHEVDGYARW